MDDRIFLSLRKILELERKRGYRNDAVIGGLERFFENWRQKIPGGARDESSVLARELYEKFHKYSRMDHDQRERLVSEALGRMPALASAKRPVRRRVPNRTPNPVPRPAVRVSRSPQAAPPPPPSSPATPSGTGLEAPVIRLPGVGKARVSQLERLGVRTVGDLLFLYPRRYLDYSKITTISRLNIGEEVTIIGKVTNAGTRKSRRGQILFNILVSDSTGTMQATWFNQAYLERLLKPGARIVLSGRVETFMGRLVMSNPEWEFTREDLVHTGRLVPIYPLTAGVTARWMRQLVKHVVDTWSPRVPDYLPKEIRRRVGLVELSAAIREIHFPSSLDKLEQARRRLAFNELFLIQLGMQKKRLEWRKGTSLPLSVSEEAMAAFLSRLPFVLTGAQRRALGEILADMSLRHPMSRLLQGDVGSGKTVVAAAAMWAAVSSGAQAALMAPTEILSEQHFRSIGRMFGVQDEALGENMPPVVVGALERPGTIRRVTIARLTGSMGRKQKESVRVALSEGDVDIVVGTHALIQEGVSFANLGLVVVDEQHRFGVAQRANLRGKGNSPHMLVMSATPIPRTLALTIYGDLDLSVIDEMPPGRKPIKTKWMLPRERERAYAFIRRQVSAGHQAFVIYPLVWESGSLDLKAATTEYKRLQKDVFPDLRLGLIHGKMSGREKDAVMRQFKAGEIDILVATAVVEVGVDVPSATVMLIEGAERFGLAQLHQFRGRVGRGSDEAYCILIPSAETDLGIRRLQIMEETQDGFVLAEKDLELRGPGEFLGTRQSGLPDLRMARLSDRKLLEQARVEAAELFRRDPELRAPEYAMLRERLAEFWKSGSGDLS